MRIVDNLVGILLSFRNSSRQVPMKLPQTLSIVVILCFAAGIGYAQGSDVANQSLTLEVKPITKIAVSGNPNALIITDATAGMDLTSVSDEHTTYSITTNMNSMKIVASINNGMPSGTTLSIELGSGAGISKGSVDISNATTPVDVVTGIGQGNDVDQSIRYVFAANADVPAIPNDSRTITLTLTN